LGPRPARTPAPHACPTRRSSDLDRLPYTARVHAENILRKADPAIIDECLQQIIEVKRDRDFPWFPARVVCHDILGQTALVDLARSEEHTAELQSRDNLVCRLLLE